MCFFVIFVNTVLFLLVLLGGMANILDYSRQILTKRKRSRFVVGGNVGIRRNIRWVKKLYTSCRPVKFKFGKLNFVDRLTPLNCTVFANRLTLKLFLVGGKALRDS